MNYCRVFESGWLQAIDDIAEESRDNTTKMLAVVLESAVLKPYRGA